MKILTWNERLKKSPNDDDARNGLTKGSYTEESSFPLPSEQKPTYAFRKGSNQTIDNFVYLRVIWKVLLNINFSTYVLTVFITELLIDFHCSFK